MMPAKNNQKQANKKQKREAHCLQWDVPIVNSDGKESAHSAGDPGSIPGLVRLPWGREWLSTPVFLPGEFHGQRS